MGEITGFAKGKKMKKTWWIVIIIALLLGCRNSITGVDDILSSPPQENSQDFDISGATTMPIAYEPHISGASLFN